MQAAAFEKLRFDWLEIVGLMAFHWNHCPGKMMTIEGRILNKGELSVM